MRLVVPKSDTFGHASNTTKAEQQAQGRRAIFFALLSSLTLAFLLAALLSQFPWSLEWFKKEVAQVDEAIEQETTNKASSVVYFHPRERPVMCNFLEVEAEEIQRNELYTEEIGSSQPARLLYNGIPFEGSVQEGEYAFFQICLNDDSRHVVNVQVIVENLGGNPDLYISFQRMRPLLTNSDIISAKLRTERVEFSSQDDVVQEALGGGGVGVRPLERIYLSVLGAGGAMPSKYRITVSAWRRRGNLRSET